ncbi:MAG: flagellar protein export ATPase FliI [Alphaproteobacteria bacterium]
MLEGLKSYIDQIPTVSYHGTLASIQGGLVQVTGLPNQAAVGNQCLISPPGRSPIPAEIVGFKDQYALLMAFEALSGVGPGCPVEVTSPYLQISPSEHWLGRIINGFGNPVDNDTPLIHGAVSCPVMAPPMPAHERSRMGPRLDIGVRALNTFTTCCEGQRLGIFAGSGVGKSVLLSQIAKFSQADVIVIGLIGERGREVQEFVEDYLGPEGLSRAVVVVATSDEPALMRRQAAYVTLAVAEYFRDQGKKVLCMMDSVTRFAMALREIGLAIGEPPASKGYTPSVFAEMPRLLERAGPGAKGGTGSITGLFTVLVEGDDTNEPISDTVRGILDGHIILDRKIAARNRFPAVDVLRSISRSMPDCNSEGETHLINTAKEFLMILDDMGEMIRLGAYRQGADPKVDAAMFYQDVLEGFLAQKKHEHFTIEQGFEQLNQIFMADDGDTP